MSQGIHLLYNSEIEELYRQNTASVLARFQEYALQNPYASALEVLAGVTELYGVSPDETVVEDVEPQSEVESVADAPVEDKPVEDAPVEETVDSPDSEEEHPVVFQDDNDSWEDDEDDQLLRDDPDTDPLDYSNVTPVAVDDDDLLVDEESVEDSKDVESVVKEEEEEEDTYDGPQFVLNAWGLPEPVVEEGQENRFEERETRRVVLEGIDE